MRLPLYVGHSEIHKNEKKEKEVSGVGWEEILLVENPK